MNSAGRPTQSCPTQAPKNEKLPELYPRMDEVHGQTGQGRLPALGIKPGPRQNV